MPKSPQTAVAKWVAQFERWAMKPFGTRADVIDLIENLKVPAVFAEMTHDAQPAAILHANAVFRRTRAGQVLEKLIDRSKTADVEVTFYRRALLARGHASQVAVLDDGTTRHLIAQRLIVEHDPSLLYVAIALQVEPGSE